MYRREEYHKSQGRKKCQERKHQMLQKNLIKYAMYAFDLTIKKLLILVKSGLNGTLS